MMGGWGVNIAGHMWTGEHIPIARESSVRVGSWQDRQGG